MAFQGIKHRFCGEQLMKASICATRMKTVAALTSSPTVLPRTVLNEAVIGLITIAHVMMSTTTASPLQIQALATPLQIWTSSVRAERVGYICIYVCFPMLTLSPCPNSLRAREIFVPHANPLVVRANNRWGNCWVCCGGDCNRGSCHCVLLQ